ncbi:MAG TPA: hypothetical protein PKA28_01345 [Methylomusa anaerophila]|uniref:Uncharacterized protein n=1 Tax=Methylomusa anaerophila TaxID=1930071 RepID=A0A348APU3_9FIRM|nr:hypothetical protein [Methylomusa anaerophila]BBB93091.1 hypothetical protein MAMMFC1_03800 [Methylomusa anaerophila]HML87076.1 hypothetical protein [Methylomusa anaerophila]
MWQEIFDFGSIFFAVVCCSIAVKLADDYLDRVSDLTGGQVNWAERLGPGTMVYAMLFLAIAAGINAKLSLSLFIGSYVVGMFNDLNTLYPSRLTGFYESVLAVVLGMILLGWRMMFFSLCFVFAVQLIDDCIDAYTDRLTGQRNMANHFGKTECMLTALLGFLLAWVAAESLIIPTFIGTASVYMWSMRQQGGRS